MTRRAALFAVVAFLWSTAALAQAPTGAGVPVVVARGQALVKRAPDQAWVTIAAEARATAPAEAQRVAATAMTSVQSALAKVALPADAIKTTGYSLQPDLEWTGGRSRVRGYIARNEIEVRVDALDKLGGVIDAAGSSGATSMSGLRFDLKDRDGAEREALRLAVQDAMARARAMAAGAGAELGNIVRIDEQVDRAIPMPPMPMRMAEAAASTPITPGDVAIHAQVTVSIAIK
jgi:uncharacterized protein YggE